MINEDNMRAWVAGLRSGKFEQAEGELRSIRYDAEDGFLGYGYCCLGVVTELYCRSRPVELDDNAKTHLFTTHTSLPEIVTDWLGIDYDDPHLTNETTAIAANDELHWDFNLIADAIEKRYLPNDWAATEASRNASDS